jgi:acetyltransferase-like isoleucine patch superfamily enzyme
MIGLLKRMFLYYANIRRVLRIALLRLQGNDVSWSAIIHKTAEIDAAGGFICIGERSFVDKGVIIRAYGGRVEIGADCSINPYSVLYGHGGLKIGNGVRIATHVVFIPANHIFSNSDEFIYKQGETMKGICVGDDVWIGAGVRVLDGVIIKNGVVIGAGAVVTKSLDAYGVYVGVPARKILARGTKRID